METSKVKTQNKSQTKDKDNKEKIAVILIRGRIGIRKDIKSTLKMLRLNKKNVCVVVNKTPDMLGMIIKCKDYVTFGEIDDETHKLLIEKRGKEYKGRLKDSRGKIKYNKFLEYNGKKLNPYFRLNPPKGGFERKGTKNSYNRGGALGYRGNKINDLIKKMI